MTVSELRDALAPLPAGEVDYILRETAGDGFRLMTEISPAAATAARLAAARRAAGEPLQYIFGRAYFMDLVLRVDPRVLIPRPETELLAEFAVSTAPRNGSLLDICTGSGAVALAVKHLRPDLAVTASDLSSGALEVAAANRAWHSLEIELLEGDLFLPVSGRRFDFITANPPYVGSAELAGCPAEVRDFEPHLALEAAESGLAVVRRIAETAADYLNPGGWAAVEIGETQHREAEALFRADGRFSGVRVLNDLCGRPRLAVARREK